MSVIQRLRRQGGLKKLKYKTCSSCKNKYLSYRIFVDPTDRKQKCFPSCWKVAEDTRVLASLPDFEPAQWTDPRGWMNLAWLE